MHKECSTENDKETLSVANFIATKYPQNFSFSLRFFTFCL